jgi:RHS repeat-associated protein
VGGLLLVRSVELGVTNFVAHDGNGNVAALVNVANGAVTAQYEYGPFGELLRATGESAKANPFRFSTKYQDDESDYLYYGYRSYNPSTGRWLNGDPIGEKGGAAIRREKKSLPPLFMRSKRLPTATTAQTCEMLRKISSYTNKLC